MSTSHRSALPAYRVSLPMYDWPEQQDLNDRFWNLLRRALIKADLQGLPLGLSRGDPLCEWQNPQTLLSQTCGYPLVHALKDQVQLVGTPCYDIPLCRDGYYASAVLVRSQSSGEKLSDYRRQRIAINSMQSQSGYSALINLFHDHALLHNGHFRQAALITGSHRESIRAVACDLADICAVDPVSWHLARRYEKCSDTLRVLCTTPYTPALPLICSSEAAQRFADQHDKRFGHLTEVLRDAWTQAVGADLNLTRQLRLNGLCVIDRAAYEAVPTLAKVM